MAPRNELDFHRPSDSGPPQVCLWDQEDWPCKVQQVREQCAELIRTDETVPSMTIAGHSMVVRGLMADLIGAQRRCDDCGGEGGGGTMDPDDWFECTTCKGKGTTYAEARS